MSIRAKPVNSKVKGRRNRRFPNATPTLTLACGFVTPYADGRHSTSRFSGPRIRSLAVRGEKLLLHGILDVTSTTFRNTHPLAGPVPYRRPVVVSWRHDATPLGPLRRGAGPSRSCGREFVAGPVQDLSHLHVVTLAAIVFATTARVLPEANVALAATTTSTTNRGIRPAAPGPFRILPYPFAYLHRETPPSGRITILLFAHKVAQ